MAIQMSAIGGAWASWSEPLRPWLLGFSLAVSAFGIWAAHRAAHRATCTDGSCACRSKGRRRLALAYGMMAATLIIAALPLLGLQTHTH
jgi:hypothetical protein